MSENPIRKIDPFGLADFYFWPPIGDNVGHAALSLDDGTYISEWPTNASEIFFGEPRDPSLFIDALDEEAMPYVINVPGLNEQAVKEWWETEKDNAVYNAFFSNCADTVHDAIEIGGRDLPNRIIQTPVDLFGDLYNPNLDKGKLDYSSPAYKNSREQYRNR